MKKTQTPKMGKLILILMVFLNTLPMIAATHNDNGGQRIEDRGQTKQTTVETTFNEKLLQGVQGDGFLEKSPPGRRRQNEEKIDLTIDKAIQLALENNKNYLISKEEIRQYKYKLKQNLGFLPNVTLQGTKNLDEKLMEIEIPPLVPGTPPQKTTLDFTKNYEFTLQIVQPLFTGGKTLLNFKNAQLDLKIAKEKNRNARKEVILNIKKVFFNGLVLKELLEALRETLELAETNLKNIDERFKLGMASKYDRLRAELAVTAVKPDILRVKKQLELSYYNLKYMTGIPENTIVNLKGELGYTPHQLKEMELIQQSLTSASEILQLKMQIKKSNNLLKMAYGQFLPNISLVAAYSYRSDIFRLKNFGQTWEDFYTINLAIHFPIFTGLKRSAQVGEVKVMKKILELNAQQLNEAVTLQTRNFCMTAQQEYENIQMGLKNVETAKEGVRIARLNYDEGLISILELNSSITELTRAKVQFLQAVYNYNIAIAEIEKISGIQLNGSDQ
jgi:outer membrane protein